MFKRVGQFAASSLSQLGEEVGSFASGFSEDTFKIAVTGLSRSGKSMLFTTLITLLSNRAKPDALHALPLLRGLPVDDVEDFEIRAIEGYESFPIGQALKCLQAQSWPEPTDKIYGFELVLRLRPRHFFERTLASYGASRSVVFQFFDYPGEWLTDLPMLNQNYSQWSLQVVAQLGSDPQRSLAMDWLDFVGQFHFELDPTPQAILALTQAYRSFLILAKSKGISLLQPSGFLLEETDFNWMVQGFVPLPTEIVSDLKHPWLAVMNEHFVAYQLNWLSPLRQKYFMGFDRQIILLDLLTGVAQGRNHLLQLKEALTRLSEVFIQEQKSWWQFWLGGVQGINRVAFVATKGDLLPRKFHPNLLSLLKDVSQGALAKYSQNEVVFEHFIISALSVTKSIGEGEVLYLASPEETRCLKLEFFPSNLGELSQQVSQQGGGFKVVNCVPPRDAVDCMLMALNLDRLFDYMMNDSEYVKEDNK